jgi:arabinofuranosyltransferase
VKNIKSILKIQGMPALCMYVLLCLGCTAIALAAVGLMNLPVLGIDDAYIYFVYADNVSSGHGLVYNIGSERVEGFSSALWMAVCAIAFWLTDTPLRLIFIISVLLTALTLYALTGLVRSRCTTAASIPLVLLIAWVASSPTWFLWNIVSLMETGLWTCLVVLSAVSVIRLIHQDTVSTSQPWYFATLTALLVLARPESFVWAPWFIASYTIILRWKQFSGAALFQKLWPVVILPTITLLALTLFRLSYFGYPLPNTYYAKVSPDVLHNISEGAKYVYEYLANNGFAVVVFLMALVAVLRWLPNVSGIIFFRRKSLSANQLALYFVSSTCLLALFLGIIIGGDFFEGYRIFQPVFPLLFLVIYYSYLCFCDARPARTLPALNATRAGALIITTIMLFTAVTNESWFYINRPLPIYNGFLVAERGLKIARILRSAVTNAQLETPSLAVVAAGSIKTEWPDKVLDLMGLNDTEMAHSLAERKGINQHAAFDPRLFYQQMPEVVAPNICTVKWDAEEGKYRTRIGGPIKPGSFIDMALKGMPHTDRFKSDYNYAAVRVGDEGDWVCSFVRKDYALKLAASESIDYAHFDY